MSGGKSDQLARNLQQQFDAELRKETPDWEKLRTLSEFEDVDISKKDEDSGMTIVHAAAFHGEVHVMNTAIRRGVEADAETKLGRTPLHFAAMGNQRRCVTSLVNDHKVNVNKTTIAGLTPLHLAARAGAETVINFLLFQSGQFVEAEREDAERHRPIDLAKNQRVKDLITKYVQEQMNDPIQSAAGSRRASVAAAAGEGTAAATAGAAEAASKALAENGNASGEGTAGAAEGEKDNAAASS